MGLAERNYTVYMHITPCGKKYIGITCQGTTRRWGREGEGYKRNYHFWNAIKKYGWEHIIHQTIAEGITASEARNLEIKMICEHKTQNPSLGYNNSAGGEHGFSGGIQSNEARIKISAAMKARIISDETKAKQSAAMTGNKRALGSKRTAEAKAKISSAMAGKQIGREVSDETRAKLRAAMRGNQNSIGFKHTIETRAKLSAARTGKPRSEETKGKLRAAHNLLVKDVECITLDGKAIGRYASLVDAEEKTGISKKNIWKVCAGKNKSAGGFIWRYTF